MMVTGLRSSDEDDAHMLVQLSNVHVCIHACAGSLWNVDAQVYYIL